MVARRAESARTPWALLASGVLVSLATAVAIVLLAFGHLGGGLAYVANHSIGEGITVVDQGGHVVARLHPGLPGVYDFGFFGVTADEKRGLIYATKRDFGVLPPTISLPRSADTQRRALSNEPKCPS